jgi:hypothetical protein
MNRFVFRFFNAAYYRSEEVVIVGQHYDDARTAAWTVLGEMEGDRGVRLSWRLVSTEQRPVWAWVRDLRAVEA